MTKPRQFSRADIVARLFNTPLAVTAEKAEIVLGVLGERLNVGSLIVPGEGGEPVPLALADLQSLAEDVRVQVGADDDDDDEDLEAAAEEFLPFQVIDGAAVIRIRGTLVMENGLDPWSGMTGYDGIRFKFARAMASDQVRGVVFDIESPGGEVRDLNELVDAIAAGRGKKPMRAMVHGMAASAAYAIAAAADEITVPTLGDVGSIGVLCLHADFRARLKKLGVKVTLFQTAPRKAEFHPFKALSDEAARKLTTELDVAHAEFRRRVATLRGMSEEAVDATEGAVFMGQDAVDAGLADKVMPWPEALAEFIDQINGPSAVMASMPPRGAGSQTQEENEMSNESETPAAETEQQAAATNAPEAPGAETPTPASSGAPDRDAILAAERERVKGIRDACPRGYEALADKAIQAGDSVGDFAQTVLAQQRVATEAASRARDADAEALSENLPDPAASGGPAAADSPEAAGKFMLGELVASGNPAVAHLKPRDA